MSGFAFPGCALIDLPKYSDGRGNLAVVQPPQHIPFPIARVFYMYGMPEGAQRGAHAHRRQSIALIMARGACLVHLDDAQRRQSVSMQRPDQALLIGPGIWHELDGFAAGSVCLVLASGVYDEADYVRDKAGFQAEFGKR